MVRNSYMHGILPEPFFIICLVTLVLVPMSGQAGQWIPTGEKEGVCGYMRPNPQSPMNDIKAVGVVDSSITALNTLFHDVPAMEEYIYLCSDARRLDLSGNTCADEIMVYIRMDMPWPVRDRDAVGFITFDLDQSSGTLTGRGHAGHIELVPPVAGVVRMPLGVPTFILEPVGPSRTRVSFILSVDPGGSLPGGLMNMLTRDLGVNTILRIRKSVRKY